MSGWSSHSLSINMNELELTASQTQLPYVKDSKNSSATQHFFGPCLATRTSSGWLLSQSASCPPPNQRPYIIPNMTSNGRGALPVYKCVDSRISGVNCLACEGGLVVTLSEEMSVNYGGDNRALESYCPYEDPGKDRELNIRHYSHGGFKIRFRPHLELLRNRMRCWRTARCCRWSRRKELGHQPSPNKRQDME